MPSIFDEQEDSSLQQRLADLEAQIAALNPRNFAGIQNKELRAAVRANLFGDGIDGDYILDGTQAAVSGLFGKSGSTYTLLRDAYFNTLEIKAGVILKPNGFRIFTKDDFINRGTVEVNGGDGGDGDSGTTETTSGSLPAEPGGSAGVQAYTSGSLSVPLAGLAGGDGEARGTTPQENGTAGSSVTNSVGVAGSGGGGGGNGGDQGGGAASTGGAGGNVTAANNLPRTPFFSQILLDTDGSQIEGSAQSGSGGGGSNGNRAPGNSYGTGGGGGGSGSSGGVLAVYSNRIINEGIFEATGGDGGDGGDGGAGNEGGGGGGGGGGGAGGVIILCYGALTGSGTTDVSGGAAGSGGTGPGSGVDGADGGAGTDGNVFSVEVG